MKCEICKREIVGPSAEMLMTGSNGNRRYKVCLMHTADGPVDVAARIEKNAGMRVHRMGVKAKTIKKLVRAAGEL